MIRPLPMDRAREAYESREDPDTDSEDDFEECDECNKTPCRCWMLDREPTE